MFRGFRKLFIGNLGDFWDFLGEKREQKTTLASMMGVSGLVAKPIRVIMFFY